MYDQCVCITVFIYWPEKKTAYFMGHICLRTVKNHNFLNVVHFMFQVQNIWSIKWINGCSRLTWDDEIHLKGCCSASSPTTSAIVWLWSGGYTWYILGMHFVLLAEVGTVPRTQDCAVSTNLKRSAELSIAQFYIGYETFWIVINKVCSLSGLKMKSSIF